MYCIYIFIFICICLPGIHVWSSSSSSIDPEVITKRRHTLLPDDQPATTRQRNATQPLQGNTGRYTHTWVERSAQRASPHNAVAGQRSSGTEEAYGCHQSGGRVLVSEGRYVTDCHWLSNRNRHSEFLVKTPTKRQFKMNQSQWKSPKSIFKLDRHYSHVQLTIMQWRRLPEADTHVDKAMFDCDYICPCNWFPPSSIIYFKHELETICEQKIQFIITKSMPHIHVIHHNCT